jgi:hypothetical protein
LLTIGLYMSSTRCYKTSMNCCRAQYSQPSLVFRTGATLPKKLPTALLFLLTVSAGTIAGCSSDTNSVGPSNTAPQIGPGSQYNITD